MRSRNGFSLIELLTVIAIIAILAAIIFPVMATVKKRAQTTKCMTNFYNIATALKMFKQDNNRYPTSLAGAVQTDPGTGAVIPFDQTKGDCLFPEYTRSGSGIETFHCPLSITTSKTATVAAPTGTFYAYDSYDVYTPAQVTTTTTATAADVRYTTTWAPTLADVAYYSGKNSDEVDYKRQLRFKFPPDNTVITWCCYHATSTTSTEKIPVLYLNAQTEMKPVNQIMPGPGGSTNGSMWRTTPGQ